MTHGILLIVYRHYISFFFMADLRSSKLSNERNDPYHRMAKNFHWAYYFAFENSVFYSFVFTYRNLDWIRSTTYIIQLLVCVFM